MTAPLPLLSVPVTGFQNDKIAVRLATRDLFENVRACLKQANIYRTRYTEHRSSRAWAESLFDELDIDTARRLYLVEHLAAKEPAGVLELVRDNPYQVTIALFVVGNRFRLQGVGRQTIVMLAKQLGRKDIRRLALGVSAKNHGGFEFWERLGFVQTGQLGKGTDRLITMEAQIQAVVHR